ncbi:MAG: hypothetical protein IIB00_06510, partial [candidate division Zixibacteria bacterium]|nr:hypothetical protein [candidate division Zixibacteria bacterium]
MEKLLHRGGLDRRIGDLSIILAMASIVIAAPEIFAEVSQETAAEIKVDSQEATSSVSSQLNEIRIDTVIIIRNNVFTREQAKKLWLYRYVNKIHITTRENVVKREILLGPGDIFDTSLAYETERNLRNKPFIFDSQVYLDTLENGAVALRVETIDKWSLSGGVEFRRQGGRSQVELGFTERNLLGYGHMVSLNYFLNEVDPNFLVAGFGVSRIFSSPYKVQMKINDNPLNREIVLRADRAFVRQSDKLGLRTQLRVFRRREAPKLIEADTVALVFEEGVDFQFVFEPRFGSYYTKFLPRLTYQYKNSNRDDAIIFDPFTRDSAGIISGPMGKSFTLPVDSSRHETIL